MLEVLIFVVLIFAWVWTRLKKTKINNFDDFIELKWLIPSRETHLDLEVYAAMRAERGVCWYKGQVSPWSSRVCTCTGWKFKKHYRGTIYCECGDQYSIHRFKRSSKTSSSE
jgi:hypothetical protein